MNQVILFYTKPWRMLKESAHIDISWFSVTNRGPLAVFFGSKTQSITQLLNKDQLTPSHHIIPNISQYVPNSEMYTTLLRHVGSAPFIRQRALTALTFPKETSLQ
jgi:hypothetical protein